MNSKFYAVELDFKFELTEEQYSQWYEMKGRNLKLPKVQIPTHYIEIEGGFSGMDNGTVENWKPFYLVFITTFMGTTLTEMKYFDTFMELANQYEVFVTANWYENDGCIDRRKIEGGERNFSLLD